MKHRMDRTDRSTCATTSRRRKVGAQAVSLFGLAALPLVMSAPAATSVEGSAGPEVEGQVVADAIPGSATRSVFSDQGYSLGDAQVLAERWSGDEPLSVTDVEFKASALLVESGSLRDSLLSEEAAVEGVDDAELKAVFYTQYTQDDADLLAQAWGVSSKEAEIKAGGDVKALGVLPMVEPSVDEFPEATPDPAGFDSTAFSFDTTVFADRGYSRADAEVLIERWSGDEPLSVRDVEFKASTLLVESGSLRDSVFSDEAAVEGVDDAELKAALYAQYTQADVDALAQAWGVSWEEAEIKAGGDVKALGVLPMVEPSVDEFPEAAPDPAGAGQEPAEFEPGEAGLDTTVFADRGYSRADAEVLAERWRGGTARLDIRDVEDKVGALLVERGSLRDSLFSDEAAVEGVDDAELKAAFYAQYTQDDADLLAQAWGVSAEVVVIKAGGDVKALGVLPMVEPSVDEFPEATPDDLAVA